MLKDKNVLLDVDSYKLSMPPQYPPNITNVSSYITARAGADEIVWFGLQAWLMENIDGYRVSASHVNELEELSNAHGVPAYTEGWRTLIGKPLPVRIQSLPEGMIVRPGTPLAQIMNVNPSPESKLAYWYVTTHLETSMIRVWYTSTVATRSREAKKKILRYLRQTGTPEDVDFKLHDFGFRGVSSWESGCLGGMAHLVNFKGTDTIGALLAAREYYGEQMAGFSIPAAEHSTITSWGRENEDKAYVNMIERFSGEGKIYAVVSDSYDIYSACEKLWGEKLRQSVIDGGGTLVVRPDSGDPLVVVLKCLEILGDKFGTTTNSKGYKVLNNVRVIQGDGVNLMAIEGILGKMMVNGWSADNVAFGMGGGLLQQVNRDTLSFAMKCSAVSYDNAETWVDVMKDPITQPGKASKAGRFAVIADPINGPTTIREERLTGTDHNLLRDKWINGRMIHTEKFSQVRELAGRGLRPFPFCSSRTGYLHGSLSVIG